MVRVLVLFYREDGGSTFFRNCVPTHPWHQPATTYVNNTRSCKYSWDAPDDERKYCSKHVEQSRNNKLSYTVASCWSFSKIISWTSKLHILSRIKRDIINVHWSSWKAPVILSYCIETWIFSTDYQISWKPVQYEFSCSMWKDGRTDMTKVIVAFRNFANAPQKTNQFMLCMEKSRLLFWCIQNSWMYLC
jgi:hypothetical protein